MNVDATITTITSRINVETLTSGHETVIKRNPALPEEVTTAVVIGACLSILKELGHEVVALSDHAKTKNACAELGRQLERFIEDTLRWAGMEDQIGLDDPDQQLAWEKCAEMPGRIQALTEAIAACREKLAALREYVDAAQHATGGEMRIPSTVLDNIADMIRDDNPKPICPECVAGKHTICVEYAWDEEKDELVHCQCNHHGEEVGR